MVMALSLALIPVVIPVMEKEMTEMRKKEMKKSF